MKIRVMSDIHTEFMPLDFIKTGLNIPSTPEDKEETVLVLAGDIGMTSKSKVHRLEAFIDMMREKFHSVVMVAGNHEFYYNSIETSLATLYQLMEDRPNFHFLNNDFVCINGVEFIGGTLWTDLNGECPMTILDVKEYMNDYHVIQRKYKESPEYQEALTTDHTLEFHYRTKDFIYWRLKDSKAEKKVVVTHHLPSEQLINARWKTRFNLANHAYFSNLDHMLEMESAPDIWICGHTHDSIQTTIGKTRCVINPFGYHEHETNSQFDSNLTLEI